MSDPDKLLNSEEAAALCDPPMTAADWRGRVARGTAPKADDPGDLTQPANRRNPRWERSTVLAFNENRRRPGRPPDERIDLSDTDYEILYRKDRPSTKRYLLRSKTTHQSHGEFASRNAAIRQVRTMLDNEPATS